MKSPKTQKRIIPLFLVLLLLSISISYYTATYIEIEKDELGALLNLYIPIIVGLITFLIIIVVLIFSKKGIFTFYTLFFLIAVNLATGLYLKVNFKTSSFFLIKGDNFEKEANLVGRFSSLILPVIDSSNIKIENMDGFPATDLLVFSAIHKADKQVSDIRKINLEHRIVTFRLTNNNPYKVTFTAAEFSDEGFWRIARINTANGQPKKIPFLLNPSEQAYVTVDFTADRIESRIKAPWWKQLFKIQNYLAVQSREINYQKLKGATCINVNGKLILKTDDKSSRYREVYLNGLWQYKVEGDWEPDLQRVINTFGFKTTIGFKNFDNGLEGKKLVPFSDEIEGRYFRVAEANKAVSITKIAAYHGCCSLESADTTSYYYQGKGQLIPLFFAIPRSGQMLLPNGCLNGINSMKFNPKSSFALKIGKSDMDRTKNFNDKIGVRIWKVRDHNGLVISNAFLFGSDHLGAKGTNYDYQDEVFYIDNVKVD